MDGTKAAYDALCKGGAGVSSKPLPGVGRWETYRPPDGGEPFFRVVVDIALIRRMVMMRGSRFSQKTRIQRVEKGLRQALLNMPKEARGRTFYGISGPADPDFDLSGLLGVVLFGDIIAGKEEKDMVVAATILRHLVEDTPDALDGNYTQGSLAFLAAAAFRIEGLATQVGGDTRTYDLPRTWQLREVIFDEADLQRG